MPRRTAPSKADSALLPPWTPLPDSAIQVPATAAEWAQARAALLAASALGFDTESKPIFRAGQHDDGPHIVQLATPRAAWVLQLRHPQALALAREVLAAPHITKVGFGLDNDLRTLPQRLGVQPANVLDLDKVFRHHGFGHNTGVRAAMAIVLQRSFSKSKRTSTSNWAAPTLSPAQVRYAANDAHAPALIHAALPAWQAQQPPLPPSKPPRPKKTVRLPQAPQQSVPASTNHPNPIMRWVLRFFALLCLGLGIAGVFLPGLPTTVFILMASWAAARSSPRIHAWLHRHKLFGPMLRNWEAGGYVSRRAKYSAAITMALSAAILWWLAQPWWAPMLASSCMAGVLLWLWRRPEPPTATAKN
jgi:uncharacterized membrane protein YbaN (DUF454 family)